MHAQGFDGNQQITSGQRSTSRRNLLRSLAIGGGLALAGTGAGKALAADTGPATAAAMSQWANIALTAEYLITTVYGYAIASAAVLGMGPAEIAFLKAAQAEEQDHATLFELLGAHPLTTRFSLPAGPATFADRSTFLRTLLTLENAAVGAYITGIPVFAAAGRADLAQLSGRLAAVEAEHLVLARNIAGLLPANNTSFAQSPFASVGELLAAVQDAGVLSPSGANSFSYPGPVAVDFTGVTGRHP